MQKLQQYEILKIESSRLKEANYRIKNLTLDLARRNGEIVRIANSQLLRTIFDLQNRQVSQSEIDEIINRKKYLERHNNSAGNRKEIETLNFKLDEILFVPEIINVQFADKRHYYNILKREGFFVNGIRYVPFMSSAGQIRRSSSLFIDENIKSKITERFDNGRDLNVELVPAKYSAYFALYSSSTLPVTFPNIAVVPDLILKSVRKVDFSTFVDIQTDPLIEERDMEIEFNAFDGAGLASIAFSQRVSAELGLDYIPATMIVRAPFLKGMLSTFDFHTFAKEVAGTFKIIDIYGNEVDVRNVDCIISESMFKLWSSYSSTEQYVDNCRNNHLDFGISKVAPKQDKSHCKSSYQFLQVLHLNDEQINKLCEPTLSWLDDVSSGNLEKSLLYLLGETDFSGNWLSRLDVATQALLYENELINDSYFISHLNSSIQKKKNDAKMGRLMFEGNYAIVIPDPYLHAQHIFKLTLEPLLREHEHYSNFWNKRNVKQVAGIRSPIVHESEVNVLNFIQNEKTEKWFKYLTTGVVLPANGIGMDFVINGGMDADGDILATINSSEIIAGIQKSLPIIYETRKAKKYLINSSTENIVIESQVKQIGTNKIGFYTNVSSSLYALLNEFYWNTPEHYAIRQRLKYGRVLQGLAIDSAKGLETDPFPEYWTKWKKAKPNEMSQHEIINTIFNNSILADKRPYFMRWLYPHYNTRFKNEIAYFNSISLVKWNLKFEDLLEAVKKNFEVTSEQLKLVERYKKCSFFIDNNSTMCLISHYIEKELNASKKRKIEQSRNFDYQILFSSSFKKPNKNELEKVAVLHKEYKSLRRSLRDGNFESLGYGEFNSTEQIAGIIRNKALKTISSNATELADMVIYFCYTQGGVNSKSFLWTVFGKDVLNNLIVKKNQKYVRVPKPSPTGSIEYLWEKYGMYLMNVESP